MYSFKLNIVCGLRTAAFVIALYNSAIINNIEADKVLIIMTSITNVSLYLPGSTKGKH